MKIVAFFILLIPVLTEVPYKPKDEFEIKIDYQFKTRAPAEQKANVYEAESREVKTGVILPYLVLKVNILALKNEETRVKITTNMKGGLTSKKIEVGSTLLIDVGFTDDAKDQVTANEFTLTFFDKDKKEVNRIFIKIEEDGSFYVNDEKRGKF